jgi:hypothetical protein
MAATKECPSCGSQNDVIFTNCMFCKTSLPFLDLNSISNDELVMKASEWVGRSSESFFILKSPDANEWSGKGIVRIMQAEILGNAEKYLNLLGVRATTNPTLSIIYQGLNHKLEKYSRDAKRKQKLPLFILGGGFFIMFGIVALVTLNPPPVDESKVNFQDKLDKIEIQIDEAVREKNYDYALVLIERLVWDYDLGSTSNQKKAEAYDKKRKELKDAVLNQKKIYQNGNN